MRNVFLPKSRRVESLLARLEEELRVGEAAPLDDLFDQYGADAPEYRQMSSVLWPAVELARDEGRWAKAVPVFLKERELRPDYDVPQLWLADFLDHEGRTRSAITFARGAATRCARKSTLLWKAAELALFIGEVRESIRLLAQSIAAAGRPPRREEFCLQRAFLLMAQLFDAFGDAQGAAWARRAQDSTHFTGAFNTSVLRAAEEVSSQEQDLIRNELPQIREGMLERFRDSEADRG
jgi:hypothetical protein